MALIQSHGVLVNVLRKTFCFLRLERTFSLIQKSNTFQMFGSYVVSDYCLLLFTIHSRPSACCPIYCLLQAQRICPARIASVLAISAVHTVCRWALILSSMYSLDQHSTNDCVVHTSTV